MNKNNDKFYLNIILELERSISNYYGMALTEASNDYLYENIFCMMEDSKDMTREIYNYMYSRGYIELEKMDNIELEKEISILSNKLNEL